MRKENKILVTDFGSIEEIVVIFDDDKNPYIYSYIDGDHFYRFEENEKLAYSSFCRLFFGVRCSIAQIAGWLYSEYSKSLYTFAMQSEA